MAKLSSINKIIEIKLSNKFYKKEKIKKNNNE